ncbi:pyridoxal phosphate-dependent aminotransferase [Rhizobium paknamense]|uniref:Aminotransferase n=1 Tax=Rhizobium paknamense TaxID=1206817 RepID=A0ABU0IJH8_9HYPH|nr:pyridoxal phosphate-dependent aminotransferase [Rhizobium paknamense]MDQ0458415.1 aspartate aminotransferase/aminotransferase [Rhizobium paknamense]
MKRSMRSLQMVGVGIRHKSDSANNAQIYDLALGQPDLPVPPSMKAAVIQAIHADKNGYTRTGGEAHIRDALAVKLARQHPALGQYKRDFEVVITSGATGGIYCAILSCCDIGDEVLIPDPYFAPYADLTRLAGAVPVFIDTYPEFSVTAERISRSITSKTKLLILNSPHNPTGRVIGRQELAKIVELCRDAQVGILSDEIYQTFSYTMAHTSVADLSGDAILIRGFAKSHGAAGWRLGYSVLPANFGPVFEAIQGAIYVSAPSIVHHAIPDALEIDTIPTKTIMAERRDAVLASLRRRFPQATCDGGIFIFFDVSESCKCSATAFVEAAARNGVIVVPGHVFSRRDTHCRLSLTRGLDYLLKAVDLINLTADQFSEERK